MYYQFFAKKVHFFHQNTLLDAFQTNSQNTIGRTPLKVMPLLANQDLTPATCSSNIVSRGTREKCWGACAAKMPTVSGVKILTDKTDHIGRRN